MGPSCLFSMMSSVGGVPVRGVRMVGGLLVMPGVVVFASFCVVSSSMCGVFCCLLVVFCSFLGHEFLLYPALSSRPRALFSICTEESEQNYTLSNWAPLKNRISLKLRLMHRGQIRPRLRPEYRKLNQPSGNAA